MAYPALADDTGKNPSLPVANQETICYIGNDIVFKCAVVDASAHSVEKRKSPLNSKCFQHGSSVPVFRIREPRARFLLEET